MVPMMSLLYFRDKKDDTIHCSNVPIGYQDWPSDMCLAFGNSPPETPLAKVIGGKCKFQEIVENQEDKSALVDNLMAMLSCRDKYFINDFDCVSWLRIIIPFSDTGQMTN